MSAAVLIASDLPSLRVYGADRIAAVMKAVPPRTPKITAQSGA